MPFPFLPVLLGIGVVAALARQRRSARRTPVAPITRRVFFSYHLQNDRWRTNQVYNMGGFEGNQLEPVNNSPQTTQGGVKAIRDWIDNQMHGRSCVVVLVGQEVVDERGVRTWIRYEIEKAWREGKGIVGIRIHNLKDARGNQDNSGANPFDHIEFDGVPLSSRVPLYSSTGMDSQAAYGYIANNITHWIEDAIANRRNYG